MFPLSLGARYFFRSGISDSNRGSSAPKADALPDFANARISRVTGGDRIRACGATTRRAASTLRPQFGMLVSIQPRQSFKGSALRRQLPIVLVPEKGLEPLRRCFRDSSPTPEDSGSSSAREESNLHRPVISRVLEPLSYGRVVRDEGLGPPLTQGVDLALCL